MRPEGVSLQGIFSLIPSSLHHLLSGLCGLGGQQALHRGAGGVQRVGAQVGADVRRGGVVGVAIPPCCRKNRLETVHTN